MPLRVNSQVAIIVYLFAIALLRPVSSCDALRQFRGMKITLSGHANCLSDLLIAVARAGNVNLLADASNFSKWSKSMHVSASNWSLCRVFADLCHEFQLTFQRREPFLMVWSLPDLKELYNYVSAQSYKLQDIVDVGVTSTVGNLITLRELQKYLYEQGYTAKRILELPKGESITLSLKALPKALRKKVIDEMQIRIAMEGGVSGFMTWHSERVNQAMVRIIDSVTTKIFKDGQWVSKEHPGPWLVISIPSKKIPMGKAFGAWYRIRLNIPFARKWLTYGQKPSAHVLSDISKGQMKLTVDDEQKGKIAIVANEVPLKLLLSRLSERFNVRIRIPDEPIISEFKVTAYAKVNSIAELLKGIAYLFALQYIFAGDEYNLLIREPHKTTLMCRRIGEWETASMAHDTMQRLQLRSLVNEMLQDNQLRQKLKSGVLMSNLPTKIRDGLISSFRQWTALRVYRQLPVADRSYVEENGVIRLCWSESISIDAYTGEKTRERTACAQLWIEGQRAFSVPIWSRHEYEEHLRSLEKMKKFIQEASEKTKR